MSNKKNNTGYLNTGNRNTGDLNTGDLNTGNWNTGDLNTGNRNTGDLNTGNRNTGDLNTGDLNTGNRNTGNWNTGDLNTGYLNTDKQKIKIFNKETDLELDEINFPDFLSFNLTEWVNAIDMSDLEKENHPLFESMGGYLKKYDYKEKFAESWASASKEDKALLFKLPNFDAEIFKAISGIDVNKKPDELIIIGGKNYLKQDIENALKNIKSVD